MDYDRQVVAKQINELKKAYNKGVKRGAESYLSNVSLGEIIGVTDKSIKNWLESKNDIPFPYVVKFCDLFKCDVEYLLDENRVCKTKEATDICEETGLSKEAVELLINHRNNEYIRELISEFIIQINNYGSFATSMLKYFWDKKLIEQYKKSKWFDMIVEIYEAIDIEYPNSFDVITYANCIKENIEGIKAVLKNSGMSDEEVEKVEKETDGFFEEYFIIKATKRYMKVDIQNEVSQFLDEYMLDSEVSYIRSEVV